MSRRNEQVLYNTTITITYHWNGPVSTVNQESAEEGLLLMGEAAISNCFNR